MAEQTVTLLGKTLCLLHYMELRSPICIHKHLNIKLIMLGKKLRFYKFKSLLSMHCH